MLSKTKTELNIWLSLAPPTNNILKHKTKTKIALLTFGWIIIKPENKTAQISGGKKPLLKFSISFPFASKSFAKWIIIISFAISAGWNAK